MHGSKILGPAQSTRSLGRTAFDAKIVMVSNEDNEAVIGCIQNFSFGPYMQVHLMLSSHAACTL